MICAIRTNTIYSSIRYIPLLLHGTKWNDIINTLITVLWSQDAGLVFSYGINLN